MTRFGHKLNYVINTFVKHTPGLYRQISRLKILHAEFVVLRLHESVVSPDLNHTYQSLSCATAISTKFSGIFSQKRIYVKYKYALLSHIGCSFRT